MADYYVKLPASASGSSGVSSVNSGTGAVTIVGSGGTSVSTLGNVVTVSSTAGGSGTVTSVSVASANGLAGTVANATTTPAITLSTSITGILKGNGTAISAAVSGTDYQPAGNYVTVTGTQTLTNKTITKKVATPASGTSISPNTDSADIVYQANTAAAGTLTINADAGTAQTEGKSLLIEISSTNVQTFAWNAQYKAGAVALPTATSGAGKTDYYSFIWSSTASAWRFTGNALGF